MAPLAQKCSEFKSVNEALNRQLRDAESQMAISRDKHKKAKLSLQNEKEESKRLRLAVDMQRRAKEGVLTEKREMQAQLDAKDKEVSYIISSLR